MTVVKCSSCRELTPNSYGICDRCRADRTAADRDAQGLPVKVTDDPSTAAWIARLTTSREAIAS